MKGLVINQPWLGMILRGEKTWEMRSQPCRHRGPVALIEKGSGKVMGVAEIVHDLPPQGRSDWQRNKNKHQIPDSEMDEALARGWTRPWVLRSAKSLSRPVPYKHTSGGSWVNLSVEEANQITQQAGPGVATGIRVESPAVARTRHSNHADGLALAETLSGQTIDGQVTRTSVRQKGNKLYIDVEWDDGLPAAKSSKKWKEFKQAFQVIVMLCAVAMGWTALISTFLAVVSDWVSFGTAILWWIGFGILMGLSGVSEA
jgi:hypothetical protein